MIGVDPGADDELVAATAAMYAKGAIVLPLGLSAATGCTRRRRLDVREVVVDDDEDDRRRRRFVFCLGKA